MGKKKTNAGRKWLESLADQKAQRETIAQIENTNGSVVAEREFSPEQIDLEREVLRDADAGLPTFKPFTPAQVTEAEARLGRELTKDEISFGRIARPAPSLAPKFSPVPSVDPDADPYVSAIAEAERELEAEQVSKMTPAQANVYWLKKAQAEAAARETSEATRAEHLAAVSDQLTYLQNVRSGALLDPDYSADDLADITNAIRQISFPGGDPEVSAAMLGNVRGIDAAALGAKKSAVTAKLQSAGLDQSEIDAAIAKRFPEAKPAEKKAEPAKSSPNTGSIDAILAARQKLDAAQKNYETLRESKAEPELVAAAAKEWDTAIAESRVARGAVGSEGSA